MMFTEYKPAAEKSLKVFRGIRRFHGYSLLTSIMNMKISLPTLLTSLALVATAPAFAQSSADQNHGAEKSATVDGGKLIKVTENEAAWAAKARQSYPLAVCLVSDEKLESMGESPAYIYRVSGQPDRLVMFCCDGCEEDFMKSPATYVAKLDAAAKKTPKSATGANGSENHK